MLLAGAKTVVVALAFVACAALAGCAASSEAQGASELSKGYTVEKVDDRADDIATQPVDDDALLIIYTDYGTSGGGTVPVIEKDGALVQCDMTVGTQGFSTSRATYIYVDGDNVAVYYSSADVTLSLSGSELEVGTHTVEAVQYSDDDPSGAATLYRKAIYEVVDTTAED